MYHGPLALTTLQGIFAGVAAVVAGGPLGDLPTLRIHGEEDALAPLEQARGAIEHLCGECFEGKVYPRALHEIFNETNNDEVIDDMLGFVRRSLQLLV